MINPLDMVGELKKMHEDLINSLNKIIVKLDKIVEQNDALMKWNTRDHGYDPPA